MHHLRCKQCNTGTAGLNEDTDNVDLSSFECHLCKAKVHSTNKTSLRASLCIHTSTLCSVTQRLFWKNLQEVIAKEVLHNEEWETMEGDQRSRLVATYILGLNETHKSAVIARGALDASSNAVTSMEAAPSSGAAADEATIDMRKWLTDNILWPNLSRPDLVADNDGTCAYKPMQHIEVSLKDWWDRHTWRTRNALTIQTLEGWSQFKKSHGAMCKKKKISPSMDDEETET